MTPDNKKSSIERTSVRQSYNESPIPGVRNPGVGVIRHSLEVEESESRGYDPYDNPGPVVDQYRDPTSVSGDVRRSKNRSRRS